MVKSTSFCLCTARPAGFLLVIVAVCVCSVAFSGYYVHKFKLSLTPFDIMQSGHQWESLGHVLEDDTHHKAQDSRKAASPSADLKNDATGSHNLAAPSIDKIPSLNNMDISLHIANRIHRSSSKPKPTHVTSRPNKPPTDLHSGQNNAGATNKSQTKMAVWPVREKVQKKEHHLYHSSNPLYERPTRTRRGWNGERFIVYLCHNNLTCAGWGDRQHGIFSAYLLSLVTNRTFKVDFSNPCPLTKLFHPRITNWKIEPSEFEGLSSTHLYAVNDRNFREIMKEIDFNEKFPQDVVYLTTNYDYYYSLKGNPIYRDIFHKKVRNRPRPIMFADLWQGIFKMNKRVVRRFTPALKQVRGSKNYKLVCAHIRFGRNPTIPHDSDIRNTLTTIKPFWEFLKKYSDSQKYRLFVASDWEGFRKKVNEFYKDISIDVEGEIIHIDQIAQQSYKGTNNRSLAESESLCNGLEKVVADQHVLSQCDILLLTYSVFGKAASYLRRSNEDLYLMDKGKIQSLKLFEKAVRKN